MLLPFQPRLSILFLTAALVACSGDSSEQPQDGDPDILLNPSNTSDNDPTPDDNVAAAQPGLLGIEWTLETVRGTDAEYSPLPLDTTWTLNFDANGSVGGLALCNGGSGNWQADESTLSILEWNEDAAFCDATTRIPSETQTIVGRLFSGETVMSRIDAGRLFIDTGDGAQLVFSGREKIENEQSVSLVTLVSTAGFSRASNGDPVFGDFSSPYVIYRDRDLLEADYAQLPAEDTPWPELPDIDFTTSFVVGAYLPLNGSVSSEVVVRSAHESISGLQIEIARFGPEVQDPTPSSNCASDDALTAPWTLVIINSVVEPVSFVETRRPFCSGIPVGDGL